MAVTFSVENNAIIETTFRGLLFNQVTMCVLHHRYTGTLQADGPGLFLQIASLMQLTGGEYLRYTQCTTVDLTGLVIEMQKISPARFAKITFPPDNPYGLVNEDTLPPATAVAISKRPSTAGVGTTGTQHITAVPATFSAGGVLTTAALVPYQNLAIALASVIEPAMGGTVTPVLYNRTNPLASQTVAVCALQTTVRTMKRRVVGRGI